MFPLFPNHFSDLLLMQLLVIWLGTCIFLASPEPAVVWIPQTLRKMREAHRRRPGAPDD